MRDFLPRSPTLSITVKDSVFLVERRECLSNYCTLAAAQGGKYKVHCRECGISRSGFLLQRNLPAIQKGAGVNYTCGSSALPCVKKNTRNIRGVSSLLFGLQADR